MEEERYYLDIEMYWTLKEFMELYGNIVKIQQLQSRRNPNETFPLCVFENIAGETTATFYHRIKHYGLEKLVNNANSLMVGLKKKDGRFIIFSDSWPQISNVDI